MLLPAHASALERALDVVLRDLLDVAVPIGDLRLPNACPPAWLPWLAWERHVDAWRESWPVDARRQVVLNSFARHSRAGTRDGDEQVLREAGVTFELRENPDGNHHTALVRLLATRGATASAPDIQRQIEATGRASVHYTFEVVSEGVSGDLHHGAAAGARGLARFSVVVGDGAAGPGVAMGLTAAGAAAFRGSATVTLLRVEAGSGGVAGDRAALQSPQDSGDVAAARTGNSRRLSLVARIAPTSRYAVTELGLWGRIGAGADVLLAYYYRQESGSLVEASAGAALDVRGLIDARGGMAPVDAPAGADPGPAGTGGQSQ